MTPATFLKKHNLILTVTKEELTPATKHGPGTLRVWHVQNPPQKGNRYLVATPEEGARLIAVLADVDLKNADVWGNAFGLEELGDNGEWTEWGSDEHGDVNELSEELGL